MDKNKNTRKKLIMMMAVSLILLVGVTVSYGYIALVSNSKNQEISASTGDIHLVFDDADTESVNSTLKLGKSITKTFKIENKGTKPGKVQINWKNLINTYNSRSLSYILETSSNKDTGYTKVEALRENVPVSTEAKDVPLSKEITVPVGNNPIYYRVTITFNDLEDVDQESDLSATLVTQFSLTEPESISKKVIAVLDGNVKTDDPDFSGPAPRYSYGVWSEEIEKSEDMNANIADGYDYIIYSDDYEINQKGNIVFKNPKYGKYQDIYASLIGKYVELKHCSIVAKDDIEDNIDYCKNMSMTNIEQITKTMPDTIVYKNVFPDKEYPGPTDFNPVDTVSMSSNQNNYMVYSDTYKYEKFGGYFVLINPQTCKWSECYQDLVGKYVIDEEGSTNNKITLSNSKGTYINRIENTDINNLYISESLRSINEPIIVHTYDGVYKIQDDYGDSYYFRGVIKNNNVKFANHNWKILRVNGNGSIRLILASDKDSSYTDKFLNDGNSIIFNEKTDDVKYLGYMFGGFSEDAASTSFDDAFENKYSSSAKKEIDTWYENNLITYSNYISDTLFCNDREFDHTNGTTNFFKSYARLRKNSRPTLKCSQKNDRFTVQDKTTGNGALTYPIGMITADELLVAGVPVDISTYGLLDDNYLGDYYFIMTMTPSNFSGTSFSRWFTTANEMKLQTYVNNGARISPVINIKPEYVLKMVGSGKIDDPFMIPGVN